MQTSADASPRHLAAPDRPRRMQAGNTPGPAEPAARPEPPGAQLSSSMNVLLRVLTALLLATLAVTWLMGGLQARSTSQGTAHDSARVAVFSVSPGGTYASPQIEFANMAPGDRQSYRFTVRSDSEVTVRCLAGVSSTGNLPLTFSVNGVSVPVNGGAADVVTLTPNRGEATLTLTATWPSSQNDLAYLEEVDAVRLSITAEQVD